MADRPKPPNKPPETGAGEAPDEFDRDRFESTPEFAKFKEGMRRILAVPKKKLDEKVLEMKAASERIDNPNAPGRKRSG